MDYAEQIIQCYQHLSSSTNVEQASKFLIDFYNQHKAFPVLISILNSDNDETIKQYAAIGLKITLKNRWQDNIDKEEFLKPIFFLLMTTNSILVANHLIQLIAGLVEDIAPQMVITFANQAANYDPNNAIDPNFNYPMAIYASLRLLDDYMECIGVNEDSMAIYQKIASFGFQINEAAIQIAAISCTFHLTCLCHNDLGFGPVFPQSLALMRSLSGTQQIHELFDVFSKTMFHSCPLINPHLLIPQILVIINNINLPYQEREHAFRVLINIMSKYKNEIFPSEEQDNENKQNSNIISSNINNNYASYIFDATVNITQALFQEGDTYDMSPYDLIEDVANLFSESNNLLEFFWNQIPNLQQFAFGHFLVIVFIRFSIDNGFEFYLPKLTEIASFLCNISSQSQSPCLREASVLTLCSFSKTFIDEITDLAPTIQEAVFEALLHDLTPEMLTAFEKLIASIGDSDPIIIKSYEFFINLINVEQVGPQMKEQILWCISELIKNSERNVSALFPNLFDLFKSIIYIEDKNNNSQNSIKSVAIYCLAHLCKKCPSLFSPFAEDFAKFIVTNVSQVISQLSLGSQNEGILDIDTSLITQSINAYWYIVENIQDAANSTIEEMVSMLMQICQISDTRITNEIQISSITGSISIQDIALRVLCGCASKYPFILQNIIQQLLSFIDPDPYPSFHSAIGANWIALSIISLPNRAEIVPQFVNILLKMIDRSVDPQLTAKCFESLVILIEWCGTVVVDERVLQMAAKAFTFELFCFTEEQYDEDVHQNAQSVFRQSINALQNTAFQTLQNSLISPDKNLNYVGLFFQMTESKWKPMRDLGLQLLAELVGETPGEQIPNPILENIFTIASKEAHKDNYIGFFAIKKLACSSPFNINSAEVFKSFVPMMIQRLFANMDIPNPSESMMMTNDNCISALGSIVMNILGDNFLETFNIFENNPMNDQIVKGLNVPIILVILRAMPPQLDASENESVLSFYLWLFERANGGFIQEFTAVLVRLFTEPIEVMRENMLTDMTIQRLKEMLVQMVGSCGGQEFCASVLNGDEEKLMILNSYLAPQQ